MDPPALCTLSLTALIAGRDGIAVSPYFVLRFLELSRNQTMVPLSFFFSWQVIKQPAYRSSASMNDPSVVLKLGW